MSEQTIQDGLYSIPVQLDKYTCRSLGATTIKEYVLIPVDDMIEIANDNIPKRKNLAEVVKVLDLYAPTK